MLVSYLLMDLSTYTQTITGANTLDTSKCFIHVYANTGDYSIAISQLDNLHECLICHLGGSGSVTLEGAGLAGTSVVLVANQVVRLGALMDTASSPPSKKCIVVSTTGTFTP